MLVAIEIPRLPPLDLACLPEQYLSGTLLLWVVALRVPFSRNVLSVMCPTEHGRLLQNFSSAVFGAEELK